MAEADFLRRDLQLDQPPAALASRLYEGLRSCGPEIGGTLGFGITQAGVPQCSPARPDGSITCDLYAGGAIDARTSIVIGRADFLPSGGGTRAELRASIYAGSKSKSLDVWERMIRGSPPEEICPS